MTMIEILTLFLAGVAGLLLGGIFFGGLWWTVRIGMTAKQPWLWFLGSMIVRMSVVMGGFYLIGGGQWPRLLSCLIGFIAARAVVVRFTRPPHLESLARSAEGEARMEPASHLQQESPHAT